MTYSFTLKRALLFLLVLAFPIPSLHPQKSSPTISEEDKETAQRIMSDPQLVKQLHTYVLQIQLPAIFSKIESLKLVIAHNTIKLTKQEKEAAVASLTSTKTVLEENIHLLVGNEQQPVSNLDGIVVGLTLNKQLIAYLEKLLQKKFKNTTPFSFSYEKKNFVSEEIVQLFRDVEHQFEQLELSFNEIGVSQKGKISKKITAFIDKYGLWSKVKIVGLSLFLILLARY